MLKEYASKIVLSIENFLGYERISEEENKRRKNIAESRRRVRSGYFND